MRVLFSHSYFLRLDRKQWEGQTPYPPLATLYAMACLRERSHEIALHDTMFAAGPESVDGALEGFDPEVFVVYDDSFNYLTKMCLSKMQDAAFEMIRRAKARGCRVVVCGSDATDHRRRYLDRGADAVILGEGEAALVEVIDAWDRGADDLGDIAGLARLDGGELVETGRRPPLKDIDALPRPAWDAIDLEPYERAWRARWGRWSLNLVSSRGCPYSCTWCAKPIWGSQYVVHSPERMIDDLQYLRQNNAFDHIWFCDDIFGLKPEWAGRFADGVEAAGLDFSFSIQARVDSVLRDGVAENLARAGLETAWIGAESGSQSIVDAMKKGVTVEQIYAATRLLQSHGVRVAFFLQFGYLGETRKDIDKTIQMVLDLMPDEIGISVSYPLPGTPFYNEVASQLVDKTNWTESDDLDLMYKSTYQPAFYKRLHRYVHKIFQRQRGYRSLKRLAKAPWRADRKELRTALATGYYLPMSLVDGVRLRRLQHP